MSKYSIQRKSGAVLTLGVVVSSAVASNLAGAFRLSDLGRAGKWVMNKFTSAGKGIWSTGKNLLNFLGSLPTCVVQNTEGVRATINDESKDEATKSQTNEMREVKQKVDAAKTDESNAEKLNRESKGVKAKRGTEDGEVQDETTAAGPKISSTDMKKVEEEMGEPNNGESKEAAAGENQRKAAAYLKTKLNDMAYEECTGETTDHGKLKTLLATTMKNLTAEEQSFVRDTAAAVRPKKNRLWRATLISLLNGYVESAKLDEIELTKDHDGRLWTWDNGAKKLPNVTDYAICALWLTLGSTQHEENERVKENIKRVRGEIRTEKKSADKFRQLRRKAEANWKEQCEKPPSVTAENLVNQISALTNVFELRLLTKTLNDPKTYQPSYNNQWTFLQRNEDNLYTVNMSNNWHMENATPEDLKYLSARVSLRYYRKEVKKTTENIRSLQKQLQSLLDATTCCNVDYGLLPDWELDYLPGDEDEEVNVAELGEGDKAELRKALDQVREWEIKTSQALETASERLRTKERSQLALTESELSRSLKSLFNGDAYEGDLLDLLATLEDGRDAQRNPAWRGRVWKGGWCLETSAKGQTLYRYGNKMGELNEELNAWAEDKIKLTILKGRVTDGRLRKIEMETMLREIGKLTAAKATGDASTALRKQDDDRSAVIAQAHATTGNAELRTRGEDNEQRKEGKGTDPTAKPRGSKNAAEKRRGTELASREEKSSNQSRSAMTQENANRKNEGGISGEPLTPADNKNQDPERQTGNRLIAGIRESEEAFHAVIAATENTLTHQDVFREAVRHISKLMQWTRAYYNAKVNLEMKKNNDSSMANRKLQDLEKRAEDAKADAHTALAAMKAKLAEASKWNDKVSKVCATLEGFLKKMDNNDTKNSSVYIEFYTELTNIFAKRKKDSKKLIEALNRKLKDKGKCLGTTDTN